MNKKLILSAVVAALAAPFARHAVAYAPGVPSAIGYPTYSGTFIPEVWSGKLVEKFYDATVFGEIANTDYEGEITSMGDKVKIRTVPNITVRTYKKGGSLVYENPESANVELNVDQAKYFGFKVDDIDKFQSDLPLMDKWAADGGEQMKIAIDTDILGAVYPLAAAANKGATAGRKSASYNLGATGSPFVVTVANVLELITAVAAVGDEQNWPETGRWMVIPAWMRWVLMNSDLKNASLAGDESSILRNGRIGMVDRFMIYVSNNVASVVDGAFTAYHVVAGHISGLTFASQMTQMETLKAESTFGNIVRGLNVYGYQVVKPESIADVYVRKG
jgi:hypothetical protein